MKFLIIILLCILGFSATTNAKTHVLGEIVYGVTAEKLCTEMKDGDILLINSGGGSVSGSLKLSRCVNNTDILVKVRGAYSAATIVTMGANKVCFYNSAELGFHSPAILTPSGRIQTLSIEFLREVMRINSIALRAFGYTQEDIDYVVGITLMTDHADMYMVPRSKVISLLGKRYVGTC